MKDEQKLKLIQYRINRAQETLEEVNILIKNKLWSTAINRLYYACYYAVIALLVKNNISAQTHSGVRQMFGLHFAKPGLINKELAKFYTDIFDKRQTGVGYLLTCRGNGNDGGRRRRSCHSRPQG